VIANGLLQYKLNLGEWVKNFNVDHAMKMLFTPALNSSKKIGNGNVLNHTSELFQEQLKYPHKNLQVKVK
jgi:hypothetical protein